MLTVFPYILTALLGLCVGSFCNVLIFRLPREEEFVKTPSHCMACGHRLRWYELIPLFSWLIQGGKCRSCGAPVSRQYPIVETANAAAWLLTALLWGGELPRAALYCALFSLLLVLAVIDWRTFEIPNGLNLAILILGLAQVLLDRERWLVYVIGMCSVGGVFFLLWLATGGKGLGLGDVKLMAASGLLLGWPRALLAVILGSVSGAVIHLLRMRRGADRKLAFGPYLAAGVWASALFGEKIILAYLALLGL